jgi:hypothetical protein
MHSIEIRGATEGERRAAATGKGRPVLGGKKC